MYMQTHIHNINTGIYFSSHRIYPKLSLVLFYWGEQLYVYLRNRILTTTIPAISLCVQFVLCECAYNVDIFTFRFTDWGGRQNNVCPPLKFQPDPTSICQLRLQVCVQIFRREHHSVIFSKPGYLICDVLS